MSAVVDRVIEALLAALMATMCVIVFIGVFFRYVLVQPLGWTEEVGRFCLIWSSLLGAYIAYRRLDHIQVDAIYRRLSATTRRRCRIASLFVVSAFLAALVIDGIRYSQAFLTSYSPIMDASLGMIYLALPISAALMLLAALTNLWGEFHGRSSEPPNRGDQL
jgi:TRAP-type C4-dicarboxylate transport system permease small subunit